MFLLYRREKEQENLLPDVEKKIITLRNQQVILDSDIAELYAVICWPLF